MGVAWNLAKSRFWPFFLTILHIKIVYILLHGTLFVGSFSRSVHQFDCQIKSLKKKKVPLWKSRSIQFLESFCNQKRYFELTSYGDCKKRNLWFVLSFHQFYINLEYHHTYVFQIRLKVNSWKNYTCKIWNRRTCMMVF